MSPTQRHRPTLLEATEEAMKSTDSHWTASLSSTGMTRISRTVVAFTWQTHYIGSQLPDGEDAGHLYESSWS